LTTLSKTEYGRRRFFSDFRIPTPKIRNGNRSETQTELEPAF